MEYYEKLKIARERAEMTQTEVAKALKTNQQQIARFESGKYDMRLSRFIELCKLYKASADYILNIGGKGGMTNYTK